MSDSERSRDHKDIRGGLEQKVLEEYPRLGPSDSFGFSCHPGIKCFNKCCGDVNIVLTPYDVLRMKQRLGITSTEFLEKHTLLPVSKDMKTPMVLLRMNEDEDKTCLFLTEKGCGIYTDRPWACRMYPLGLAAQRDTEDGWRGDRFYFLLQETGCMGFDEQKKWKVSEWLENQGLDEYDEWGEAFKELTLHKFFEDEDAVLAPEKMHMLFTACYDLDKFREFVFESTMLQRFEIDEDFLDEMRYDDEALLRFAYLWLRFCLFGEKTMKVKPHVAEAFKSNVDKKQLLTQEPV